MIIEPRPIFIAISETTKASTLNVNGNCGWELFFGWILKTILLVFSHGEIYNMPHNPYK